VEALGEGGAWCLEQRTQQRLEIEDTLRIREIEIVQHVDALELVQVLLLGLLCAVV